MLASWHEVSGHVWDWVVLFSAFALRESLELLEREAFETLRFEVCDTRTCTRMRLPLVRLSVSHALRFGII
jgi:hypothetical protein